MMMNKTKQETNKVSNTDNEKGAGEGTTGRKVVDEISKKRSRETESRNSEIDEVLKAVYPGCLYLVKWLGSLRWVINNLNCDLITWRFV